MRIIALLCLIVTTLAAAPKLPVDISFVVVDFKYNSRQGVKVCEVQHAMVSYLSKFYGSSFPDERVRNYEDSIYAVIRNFYEKIWFSYMSNRRLKELLQKDHTEFLGISRVDKDKDFASCAKNAPSDPYDLSTYQGAIYIEIGKISNVQEFREKFPGIVLIDAAIAPYRINKEKMSELFVKNNALFQYRPKWHVYPKKYVSDLAKRASWATPGNYVVIKPLIGSKGKGIIIEDKKKLDEILKTILVEPGKLINHPDPSYSYWARDPCEEFIIEEFIESDPVINPKAGNLSYDGTMRSIAALVFNQGQITVSVFGMHWKTSKKALTDKGSMNELHKSFGGPAIDGNIPVEEEMQKKIEPELENLLTLLYQQMLGITK